MMALIWDITIFIVICFPYRSSSDLLYPRMKNHHQLDSITAAEGLFFPYFFIAFLTNLGILWTIADIQMNGRGAPI